MNYLTLNIFGFSCRSISSIVIIASLVGIFVFTAGCHSNSGISEPVFPVSDDISHVRNDHVSIIDGRLSFASMDDFKEFMGSIINKSDSYLDSVQSDMNFISLRSDTETMADKLGKDVDELEVVEDHFFSTVLNSNGEFQIEDTVYKITRDFVYSVPHSDSHHLNSILLRDNSHDTLNAKTTFDPIVTVFAIERSDLEVADKTNFLRRMSECEAYLMADGVSRDRHGLPIGGYICLQQPNLNFKEKVGLDGRALVQTG